MTSGGILPGGSPGSFTLRAYSRARASISLLHDLGLDLEGERFLTDVSSMYSTFNGTSPM